ncbi:unnamed protein product [marine sediment metagenome]|uniref:Uncharacterized protein n=1 Tax=marine sediment metagenome TaxID=412755 RepID=X1EPP1_9ZZZZ
MDVKDLTINVSPDWVVDAKEVVVTNLRLTPEGKKSTYLDPTVIRFANTRFDYKNTADKTPRGTFVIRSKVGDYGKLEASGRLNIKDPKLAGSIINGKLTTIDLTKISGETLMVRSFTSIALA